MARRARLRFLCRLVALSGAAIILLPSGARAQSTTTGPSVTGNTLQVYPNRYVGGVQQNLRPAGLNPQGVNFADCINDMTLQYSVELSGFSGQQLEVWASTNSDCSQDENRGYNGNLPSCWEVYNAGAINQIATSGVNVNIRVQDIVGPQLSIPNPPALVSEGSSACYAQPTSSAVQITLYFLPVNESTFVGTDYVPAALTTDLVGPAAPSNVSIADGDTLFVVNWTANDDADTYGYDVFIDPIPGQGDAATTSGTITTVYVCPDGSTDASSAADATVTTGVSTSSADADITDGDEDELASASEASTGDDGAALDASSASSSAAAGATCHYENLGPSAPAPGSTSCNSTILQSAMVLDSGVTTTSVSDADDIVYDDAGNIIDSGTVSSGIVGIGTIPCDNLVNVSSSNCASGQPAYTSLALTLNGESNATYTIKGLTDGVTYNVVVAAVDASGNVGPPSTEACDYPAPVNDFWTLYRDAGGQAGGGFCAVRGGRKLEASTGSPIGTAIATGAIATAAIAAGRRRRRRK